MTTDFRALCAELLRAWQFGDDIAGPMNRARIALAQTEPVAYKWPEPFYTKPGPEDADSYGEVQYRIKSGAWKLDSVEWVGSCGMPWFHTPRWKGAAQPPSRQPEPPELTNEEIAKAAEEALDSYRYTTELPYFLEEHASEYEPIILAFRAVIAADRARRPATQPVPVSERLPGPEDCDAEGWCWCFDGFNWMRGDLEDWHSHWLPCHALPIPEATND
jgi:hypothetical protein